MSDLEEFQENGGLCDGKLAGGPAYGRVGGVMWRKRDGL